jgi:NAD(P)-dependent dehydrogenase (short-subunit alcohol dehydrogenase family)
VAGRPECTAVATRWSVLGGTSPVTLDLAGKVAVVTGGGSGLGAALAQLFAAQGMAVAALDIDAAAAERTADAIGVELAVPATSVQCDVGDTTSVMEAALHVEATLGGCDVLCANVGVQQFGAMDTLTDPDWQWVLNVNVLGAVRTVRAFLPLLRTATGFRRIVLTSSSSVLSPGVRIGAYQASKFAVMGIGETLREELADEGIGVTVLFPGGMITRHLESSVAARPQELGPTSVDPDDLTAMIAHRPMGDGDVVAPEHAIRNLLRDLEEDAPYSVTHGSFRKWYAQRRDAMDAALDRMERS